MAMHDTVRVVRDIAERSHMRWTLPNSLTVLRLVAAPAFALSYVVFDRPTADIVAVVLFIFAALTDFFDGYFARLWKQESRFGAMLDPIADKAMVITALAILVGLSELNAFILIPATIILFREVFVSGLREFLGDQSKALKVTKLAKWKTTVQMVAIPVLLVAVGLEEQFISLANTMEPTAFNEAMLGGDDPQHLRVMSDLRDYAVYAGVALIWIAALLTAVTGWDYYAKARVFLVEPEGDG